jgi:hypothetical protein
VGAPYEWNAKLWEAINRATGWWSAYEWASESGIGLRDLANLELWLRSDQGVVLNGAGQLLTDGDMQDPGTGAWSIGNNALLTKVLEADGNRFLRIAYGGTPTPFAFQLSSVMITGREYRVTGRARGDGTKLPRVSGIEAAATSWIGTPSTDWQDICFTVIATAGTPRINLVCNLGAAPGDFVDFDDMVVKDTNPRVSAWGDLSGNGNNATQVTAANQPDFQAFGGIGGRYPGISFDPTDSEFMDIAGLTSVADDRTIFGVLKQGADTGNPQVMLSHSTAGGTFHHVTRDNIGEVGGFDGTAWRNSGSALVTGDQRLRWEWDSVTPQSRFYRNGASIGTAGYDTTGDISGNLTIGKDASAGQYYLNAVLVELIMYGRILSAVELAIISSYLSERYWLG